MTFAKEMLMAKEQLERAGHSCFVPLGTEIFAQGLVQKDCGSKDAKRKIKIDAIRRYFQCIKEADAILLLNYDKKGIKNYIGGNSLLEIGFAHVLNKKIFLLNEVPDVDLMKSEVEAIRPTIIHGDLSLIKSD